MSREHISLSRDQSRQVDSIAIERYGMTGAQLMENAGLETVDLLRSAGITGQVTICCGRGNNGGDGFVIARHLSNSGVPVKILLFAPDTELRGDAQFNYEALQGTDIPIKPVPQDITCEEVTNELLGSEWVVDSLLGTGSKGVPRAPYDVAIQAINTAAAGGGVKVLAVDLPSGLDADAGEPFRNSEGKYGPCIKADLTATFVTRKIGFERPSAREFTGDVVVIDIGVPDGVLEEVTRSSETSS